MYVPCISQIRIWITVTLSHRHGCLQISFAVFKKNIRAPPPAARSPDIIYIYTMIIIDVDGQEDLATSREKTKADLDEGPFSPRWLSCLPGRASLRVFRIVVHPDPLSERPKSHPFGTVGSNGFSGKCRACFCVDLQFAVVFGGRTYDPKSQTFLEVLPLGATRFCLEHALFQGCLRQHWRRRKPSQRTGSGFQKPRTPLEGLGMCEGLRTDNGMTTLLTWLGFTVTSPLTSQCSKRATN